MSLIFQVNLPQEAVPAVACDFCNREVTLSEGVAGYFFPSVGKTEAHFAHRECSPAIENRFSGRSVKFRWIPLEEFLTGVLGANRAKS